MSKNNVNPDHYKSAGRERQGEDIVHEVHKQEFGQTRGRAYPGSRKVMPGTSQAAETPAGRRRKK